MSRMLEIGNYLKNSSNQLNYQLFDTNHTSSEYSFTFLTNNSAILSDNSLVF